MFPVNMIHDKAAEKGLRYIVIGGHAVNVYCEPRGTLDVDFLVRKMEREAWDALLGAEGFQPRSQSDTFVLFNPPYGVRWR